MEKILNQIYSNFNILIRTKSDCKCTLELGTGADINQILSCYDSVWINEKNIKDKLNKESSNSFYNSGGIFNKLSIKDINKIINSKSEVFIISKKMDISKKLDNQNINALLWLSVETDIYKNLILYDSVSQEKKEIINSYIKEKKIIYPMDFISLPEENNRGVAYPLLCSAYERLYKAGYKYAFIEIYTLKGYYDNDNNYHELEHCNKRSAILNKNISAENIGTIGNHNLKKGDYTIVVKSEIYGLDLETGIKIMKEKTEGQLLYNNYLAKEVSIK